jgi:hypothetical protein
MEVTHTETNRGNSAIIVDGYIYRKMNVLKSGDVVYRCCKSKSCKKSITTDKDGISVVKTKNDHTCNMESNERKFEAQVLRVCIRKASGDISKRLSTLIRSALQTSTENNLLQLDVTNASKAIYRERHKYFPALPKSKDDVHDAVDILDTKTNKSENFVISNDRDSGIMIFSTLTNLQCMCRVMDELFIDGTFKCCPCYFCQLYKILLPPPCGEQGATGIILANRRGTISEKGHLKICGKRIK